MANSLWGSRPRLSGRAKLGLGYGKGIPILENFFLAHVNGDQFECHRQLCR
jgi:hypothetical protein